MNISVTTHARRSAGLWIWIWMIMNELRSLELKVEGCRKHNHRNEVKNERANQTDKTAQKRKKGGRCKQTVVQKKVGVAAMTL